MLIDCVSVEVDSQRNLDGFHEGCMLQCAMKVCLEKERITNRFSSIAQKGTRERIYMASLLKSYQMEVSEVF